VSEAGTGGEVKVFPLPSRSQLFADARGGDRWMRVTWHEEAGLVVLSLWRQSTCVGTVRLDRSQVAALVSTLVDDLAGRTDDGGAAAAT
jgi:hypothetical protein